MTGLTVIEQALVKALASAMARNLRERQADPSLPEEATPPAASVAVASGERREGCFAPESGGPR